MTRKIVYSAALVALVAATAMTVATNFLPSWLGYSVTANTGSIFSRGIGLHESCSSISDPPCRPFPGDGDCRSEDRYFCTMWRSVGFLMALACVVELATLVGFVVIMAGGKMQREKGWKILGWLLAVVAILQFVSMAFVAYLIDNDEQFLVPGWHLGASWILCTVSACVAVLCGVTLAASAFVLPPENGYEFLDDPEL